MGRGIVGRQKERDRGVEEYHRLVTRVEGGCEVLGGGGGKS